VLAVSAAQGDRMQKIYLAISVGQEVDGRNIALRVDKVSFNKNKINEFLLNNKNSWVEKFKFPEGEVNCFFERHATEVEVEDE
jgi:hypothetical protein